MRQMTTDIKKNNMGSNWKYENPADTSVIILFD